MTQRSPREIADEIVERIEYRIQAHHPRERTLIRDVIEGAIEEDRENRADGESERQKSGEATSARDPDGGRRHRG